jgi:hypothetical protein
MRYVGLFVALVLAGFALVAGCDGDNDSTGGGAVLAEGSANVTTSTTTLATITVDQPGTLRGVITWSGPPTEAAAGFKHVASSTTIGMVLGASPATTTVAVTSARVAAGTQWQLLAAVPSGPAVSVQYTVTFEAD